MVREATQPGADQVSEGQTQAESAVQKVEDTDQQVKVPCVSKKRSL